MRQTGLRGYCGESRSTAVQRSSGAATNALTESQDLLAWLVAITPGEEPSLVLPWLVCLGFRGEWCKYQLRTEERNKTSTQHASTPARQHVARDCTQVQA